MTKTATPNPLAQIANNAATKLAEAQYRLARLFTPYNFEPERADFDRVAAFMDNPRRPFSTITEGLDLALQRVERGITEHSAMLQALVAQGIEPTLSADQLFATAQANVINPSMARAA